MCLLRLSNSKFDLFWPLRFNSFTQQVCVDNAVKLSGGEGAAAEPNLRPQYKDPIIEDSDVKIPYEITWNAKFVDRISEVIDGLNVSGTLPRALFQCL